eukprot:TRINITY_DN11991_c0_g1_i1.p1 TRINITY_DN11991_c0_g1~~TRINITY_DN11991_c0_g1_i1.p1  ORF type:complete len:863 (+),score=187.00 TRINITY_DN11991_c0_g1_i1:214-2802(+)
MTVATASAESPSSPRVSISRNGSEDDLEASSPLASVCRPSGRKDTKQSGEQSGDSSHVLHSPSSRVSHSSSRRTTALVHQSFALLQKQAETMAQAIFLGVEQDNKKKLAVSRKNLVSTTDKLVPEEPAELRRYITQLVNNRVYATEECPPFTLPQVLEKGMQVAFKWASASVAEKDLLAKGSPEALTMKEQRIDEAEPLHRQLLDGLKGCLGEQHPYTLNIAQSLGQVLEEKGDHDEAEQRYREAYEGRIELLGDSHIETAYSARCLARLFAKLRRHADAEPFLRAALASYRTYRGRRHDETLALMTELSTCLHVLGHLEEAGVVDKEAYETRKEDSGYQHLKTLESANNLGLVYQDQGRLDESEDLLRLAYSGRSYHLSAGHVDTMMSCSNLAALLLEKGNLKEAETLHKELLSLRRKLQGDTHALTLQTASDLADVLRLRGDFLEAYKLFKFVWQMNRDRLGGEHLESLGSLERLLLVCVEMGDLQEAEDLCRHALIVRRIHCGCVDAATVAMVTNLGAVLKSKDQCLLEQLYTEVAGDLCQSLRTPESAELTPELLRTTGNFAMVLWTSDLATQAQELMDLTVRGCELVFEPGDPYLLACIKSYDIISENVAKTRPSSTTSTTQSTPFGCDEKLEEASEGARFLQPLAKEVQNTAPLEYEYGYGPGECCSKCDLRGGLARRWGGYADPVAEAQLVGQEDFLRSIAFFNWCLPDRRQTPASSAITRVTSPAEGRVDIVRCQKPVAGEDVALQPPAADTLIAARRGQGYVTAGHGRESSVSTPARGALARAAAGKLVTGAPGRGEPAKQGCGDRASSITAASALWELEEVPRTYSGCLARRATTTFGAFENPVQVLRTREE